MSTAVRAEGLVKIYGKSGKSVGPWTGSIWR